MRARRRTVCPLQRGTTRGSLTSRGLKGDSVICPPLTLTSEAAENASVQASGNNTASVFLLRGPLPCPFYCLRSCSNPGSFTYDQLLLCWSQTEVKTNSPLFPDKTPVLLHARPSGLFSCGGFEPFSSRRRPHQQQVPGRCGDAPASPLAEGPDPHSAGGAEQGDDAAGPREGQSHPRAGSVQLLHCLWGTCPRSTVPAHGSRFAGRGTSPRTCSVGFPM